MLPSRIRTICPNCHERYEAFEGACQACGRVRDQKTFAEIAASGQMIHHYLFGFWVLVGVILVCFVGSMAVKWRLTSNPLPAPAAPASLTDDERAARANQKAADAKFWAAKEKKEAAEASRYQAEQAGLPDPRNAAAVKIPHTSPAGGSIDMESNGVRGVEVYIPRNNPSNPSSGGGSSPPPTGGSAGKAL